MLKSAVGKWWKSHVRNAKEGKCVKVIKPTKLT